MEEFKMRYIFYGLGGIVALGAFSVFVGLVGTGVKILSTPGRVISKTLETDNVIQSYEWFYDVNAAFDSRVGQVKQFHGFVTEEKDPAEKSRLKMEMAAMQQTCRELVTKYNANSEKMNKKVFKGWNLPEVLNINNCERG